MNRIDPFDSGLEETRGSSGAVWHAEANQVVTVCSNVAAWRVFY